MPAPELRSNTTPPLSSAPDYSAIPGFADAIRHLANVSKAEVDAAIAKEQAAKVKGGKRAKK